MLIFILISMNFINLESLYYDISFSFVIYCCISYGKNLILCYDDFLYNNSVWIYTILVDFLGFSLLFVLWILSPMDTTSLFLYLIFLFMDSSSFSHYKIQNLTPTFYTWNFYSIIFCFNSIDILKLYKIFDIDSTWRLLNGLEDIYSNYGIFKVT